MTPIPRPHLLAAILCLLASSTLASRMYIPLDDAIDGATVIVTGATDSRSDRLHETDGPAVIEFTVDRCWRGGLKAGDKVRCVDWNPNSTASWSFTPGGSNLVFLKPVDPADERSAALGKEPETYFDVIDLKRIEADNPSPGDPNRPARRRVQQIEFDAACRVLDIRLVEKPADLIEAWRKVLKEETNPALLRHATEHLPKPLSGEDADRIASAIVRMPADRSSTYRMLIPLGEAKYVFKPEQLRTVIERGAPLSSSIGGLVNVDNIAIVQAALWDRVTTPNDEDYAEIEVLKRLARLAPEFTRAQLRDARPFEIEIPLLQGLGINASAFGRADYTDGYFKANGALTRRIGKAIRDPSAPFSLDFDIPRLLGKDGYREDWLVLAPLMAPLLTAPDPLRRQQTAGFLRTLGYAVVRTGDTYRLEETPPRVPLRLTIEKPTAPIKVATEFSLHYRRTGIANSTWVVRQANVEQWKIERIDARHEGPSEIHSSRGGWAWPAERPDAFVELDANESVDQLYTFRADHILHPGRYRLSLTIVQQDDGRRVDVDAWTGALKADDLEVDVIP